MKKYIIFTIALLFSMGIKAKTISDGDSLKINIDRKTKTVLQGDHAPVQGYSMLSDLRTIFKAKNITLTDSTWRYIRDIVNAESNKDTTVNLVLEGKPVQLSFSKNETNQEWNNGDDGWPSRGRSQNNNEDKVKIDRDGIHVKDGEDEVYIGKRGIRIKEGDNDYVSIGNMDGDSTENVKWKEKHSYGSLAGLNINLGLNTLNTSNVQSTYNTNDFALRPFGSRSFTLGWTRSATLTKGENARLKLAIGINFDWYNFMLDNNNIWTKDVNNIVFVDSPKSLRKSKLTTSYISVPFIPYIAFKKGKAFEYIGVGGYVGYRLNSHSKVKYSGGGKDKEFNNFYLNDFRYGLTAQLGINNFPDLFFNYDFNDLFQNDRGPKVNAISFGIKF